MRDPDNLFHLAIPCRDLDEARDFYVGALGCRPVRRYDDRLTLDFFGDQVVCHLKPAAIDPEPRLYPRHFGVTFRRRATFDALLERLTRLQLDFLRAPFVRFEGRREEHRAFFLSDPANNVLEFKHYNDPDMMY